MRTEPPEDEVDVVLIRVTSAIGEPVEAFPSGGSTIATGFALAVFFGIGGLIFCGWPAFKVIEAGGDLPPVGQGAFSWDTAVCVGGFGLVSLAIAGFVLLYAIRLRSRVLWIGPRGIYVVDAKCERTVSWESIRFIEEIQVTDNIPLRGPLGLIPMRTTSSYQVHFGEADTMHFDRDAVRAIDRLGKILREESGIRQIAWKLTRIP